MDLSKLHNDFNPLNATSINFQNHNDFWSNPHTTHTFNERKANMSKMWGNDGEVEILQELKDDDQGD
jgi:hypothetical protein